MKFNNTRIKFCSKLTSAPSTDILRHDNINVSNDTCMEAKANFIQMALNTVTLS